MEKEKDKLPDLNNDDFIRLQEIQECQYNGTYRKCDKESGFPYCTYFGVSNQRRRIDCTMRFDMIIEVTKGEEGVFSHKLPYYLCSGRRTNEDGLILEK